MLEHGQKLCGVLKSAKVSFFMKIEITLEQNLNEHEIPAVTISYSAKLGVLIFF